ncbi:HlyD family efflux transporter periplasmic adaptor subunit [uncultured Chitinophaga sp.]|uniref:HlyD family secretion protein n=1 Tax=uncultured Chitinophaga sp. TaxID=339340 RepID=UPI0025D52806|nr:HlyD family efflux transporter periplasmic adaptor subunit [uncultured Chitinophaga sp.]
MEQINPTKNKYYLHERTDEVQDIIARMPSRFGLYISGVALFITLVLIVSGFAVRYPDVITGSVTVNASLSPVKLVCQHNGTLRLNGISSSDILKADDIIAYIDNPASLDTVRLISTMLDNSGPGNTKLLNSLPLKARLGELSAPYYSYLNSLQQLQDFYADQPYEKQLASLEKLKTEELNDIDHLTASLQISSQQLNYNQKLYARDSLLFEQHVTAEAELDRSKLNYLSSENNYRHTGSSLIASRKELQQTLAKISEINIQFHEKGHQLKIASIAAYNELKGSIKTWEQQYVFRAPFDGKVQFLKFWNDKQFIAAGEQVFTIVPVAGTPYGQVILPAQGVGKVKPGQKVMVKLDNYPYQEYGVISATVVSIALTSGTTKTAQGELETYLATIAFDKGLLTNYGEQLVFSQDSRGMAEIITKDRQLIHRFFDNLKYILKK